MNEQFSTQDLKGKNIIVYDIEIKKSPDQCRNGWSSKDEMGISVACMFDYQTMMYHAFMDDNMCDMVDRMSKPGTMIVGFNTINFDNAVLRASGYPLPADDYLNNYDLMVISREGAKDSGSIASVHKGTSLDDHLKTIGLPVKSGDGALAPKLWQDGKVGELVNYCLYDVFCEKNLFEFMYVRGYARCTKYPKNYSIRRPNFG